MQWSTMLWIVIAIVALFVIARRCGGMMGGTGCGGCGIPHRRKVQESENTGTSKVA